MDWLQMSKQELRRVEVLTEVLAGSRSDFRKEPKIKTNSEKGGYRKNPRRLYGPDYEAKIDAAPAVEMTD